MQHERVCSWQKKRQRPPCQQGGKSLATHDLLHTTSSCFFALRKFTTPTAVSPPPSCRHGGNTRFGVTSGTDFVVYLKASANHGLCDHAVHFSHICFGAAHNSEVVGAIASQAMAPVLARSLDNKTGKLRSEMTGMSAGCRTLQLCEALRPG